MTHTPWEEKTIRLHRVSEPEVLEVAARETAYKHGPPYEQQVPVTAFSLPGTGKVWVGPTQDFYLDMGSEIVGVKTSGGFLDWCDSLVRKEPQSPSEEDLTEAIRRFEATTRWIELLETASRSGRDIRSKPEQWSDLRGVFAPWFFEAGRWDSRPGSFAEVVAVGMEEGKLRLELENARAGRAGTVWIDSATRRITKTAEGDEETYPRRLVPWEETTVAVERGHQMSPVTTLAKGALYGYCVENGWAGPQGPYYIYRIPTVAFVLEEKGDAWVGPQQDFYIETASGILGGRLHGSHLLWAESMTAARLDPKDRDGLNDLIELFESRYEARELYRIWSDGTSGPNSMHRLDLGEVFEPDFFKDAEDAPAPSSGLGKAALIQMALESRKRNLERHLGMLRDGARIVQVAFNGRELRLDIENPHWNRSGSVWIDIALERVMKAEEDGESVYP